MGSTSRTIAIGTALSGTLDILSAFLFGAMAGVLPNRILRYVASGPFGDAMRDGGLGAALLGLAVHYSIMAVMVTVFVMAARRLPALLRHPLAAGTAYGILLYFVMYWIVVPLRFPANLPKLNVWSLGNALFSHIVCVGIPMALVTARALHSRRPAIA